MLNHRHLHHFLSILFLIALYFPVVNAATTTNSTPTTAITTPAPTTSNAPVVAGEVIVTQGIFTDVAPNKQVRTLVRGDSFYNGDTLNTGDKSKAQVRFTDGTIVAFTDNTSFKIADYHYQEAGQQDKNFTSLVKGGFRALTGIISKNNPSAYQVSTSVAAITVRGTMYGATINKGALFVGVWKGRIVIANQAGTIFLGEGENYDYAEIPSFKSSPIGLLTEPSELAGQCQQVGG